MPIQILPDELDQSNRGRRGDRAAGVRGQGAGGKRARCRRAAHRGGARAGRVRPDSGARRRHRDRTAGDRACTRAARNQQDRLAAGSRARRHARISRRGAAEHRLGVAPVADIALEPGRSRLDRGGARRRSSARPRRPRILRAPASRCAICSSMCRRGASSCAARRPSISMSCACWSVWRCRASKSASPWCTTARPCGACRRRRACPAFGARIEICGEEFAAHVIELRHDTREPAPVGLVGVADILAQPVRSAIRLSQRPLRARQAHCRRRAPRLPGCAVQRPLLRLCAVLGFGSGAGRCQCAPAKARGAISRFAPRARVRVSHAGAGARRHPPDRGIGRQRAARLADRQRPRMRTWLRRIRRASCCRKASASRSRGCRIAACVGERAVAAAGGAAIGGAEGAQRDDVRRGAARLCGRAAARGLHIWPKPPTAWCWWTCTRRTSASCTSA